MISSGWRTLRTHSLRCLGLIPSRRTNRSTSETRLSSERFTSAIWVLFVTINGDRRSAESYRSVTRLATATSMATPISPSMFQRYNCARNRFYPWSQLGRYMSSRPTTQKSDASASSRSAWLRSPASWAWLRRASVSKKASCWECSGLEDPRRLTSSIETLRTWSSMRQFSSESRTMASAQKNLFYSSSDPH